MNIHYGVAAECGRRNVPTAKKSLDELWPSFDCNLCFGTDNCDTNRFDKNKLQ